MGPFISISFNLGDYKGFTSKLYLEKSFILYNVKFAINIKNIFL